MRSALTAIRWRARSSSLVRTRFVLFIDNQSFLALLVKSCSSSRKLNAVARKTAAIVLFTLSRPLFAYSDTDRNPGIPQALITPLLLSCSTRSRNIACSLVASNDLYSNCVCSCVRAAVTKTQSPRSPPCFVMKANLPHLTKMVLMLSCANFLSGSGTKEFMWVGQATRSAVVSFSCKSNVTSRLRGNCVTLGSGRSSLCRLLCSLDRLFFCPRCNS